MLTRELLKSLVLEETVPNFNLQMWRKLY